MWDFIDNILEFIMGLIIPDDEHLQEIASDYSVLGDKIFEKFPFISWFADTINNTKLEGLGSKDFLKIEMPSFSFFGGQTEEKTYIDVFEAYEPYRENIRDKLSILVYLCGAFVLLRHFLGDLSSNSKGNSDGEGA